MEGATEAALEDEPVCLVFRVEVFFFAIVREMKEGCDGRTTVQGYKDERRRRE